MKYRSQVLTQVRRYGGMSLLEVDNLRTYYLTRKGVVQAVDGVTFNVSEGEVFGLAGESGCGKTTTALSIMKLLPTLAQIVDGEIYFGGTRIVKLDNEGMRELRWKGISMIFQGAMNALNPVLNVGRQIVDAIHAHEDVTKEEAWERAGNLLELVGISRERIKEYPHEFSGGMRQRVMISMALSCNPKFLIADEPVTALDVIIQAQILNLIKDLQEKLHLSIMLITHDLSVLADICDKTAIMYAGKIVESSDITTIFKRPAHPYTQLLIRSFPSLRGEMRELVTIPGAPPKLINPPSGCRFHLRCPYAKAICRKEEPQYMAIQEGHYVACHLLG